MWPRPIPQCRPGCWHPGPYFELRAVAALVNLTPLHAGRGLTELRDRHLVIEQGRRYRLPHLLVGPVRRLALTDPCAARVAALDRLRAHHLATSAVPARKGSASSRPTLPDGRTGHRLEDPCQS
ncbi:hypothetical protein ABT336_06325 [Micromonospora sp. NPDC000207]|uniref:hypothetical protein n=1 Tax=Micromonospora sp. NPDC000207 TaxID=3154246 RepID=UPI00333158FF